METATPIDGNIGYFPSFEALTNNKMESVGNGNHSVNSASQNEQNSFEAGLSEAQDALLSIIEQQSNRSPDEYRSALVPFGEILRDIYETSNQTLNLSQQNNDIQSTTGFEQETNTLNQQQIPSTFHVQAPYQQQQPQQQQQQHLHQNQNQGLPANYNNTNLMNYLNPFNNSFNFYQNYQQSNTQFNPIYSTASISNPQTTDDNQIQQCKYDDYNQNIETLIETVYEDENDQNPVYLNFNVSHDGNTTAAGTNAVDNPNENHIPIQNTNYAVEQLIYPGIYPNQQQSSSFNNTNNSKLWYPESIINNGNNNINNENIMNRNINPQNYNHPEYHRLQNNTNLPMRKLSLLHSNQSAFDIYHRNGKTPYQKYNKNKSYVDTNITTNYHYDQNNNSYLVKPKNYQQYVHDQFIPIGRNNLLLQPNQKFITADMISCRPPIQTKRTMATTMLINKQQPQPHQQQTQLLDTSSITDTVNSNVEDSSGTGGGIIKELTNVDISGIDFSSLDTSDIIISKIEPKLGEPLHKKRKQDLKILDGSENFIFEFLDIQPLHQQQQQNNDVNHNKLINDQNDDIQIEKNLKNILNSSYTDDEQDDDDNNNNNNNNNNNFQLNIIKSSTQNSDEIPLSKLKVKKNKINKENLKLSTSSSSSQQQTFTNNIQTYKKQKRTLLKKSKIECCFNNHDETCSSDSDFEDLLLKNKSFKCNKCNKMFKSAKTLGTHRKRCNVIEQKKNDHDKINDINKNNDQEQVKTVVSGGFDSEHDDDPNSYPVEYLESDTELNDTKNPIINNIVTNTIGLNNNDEEQIIKETVDIDLKNNEECFRRKTRSQTKRKNVDLNYYEPSQKFPVKRKK